MNYNLFTHVFPVLEGPTIRLRQVKNSDISVLFGLLNEPDTAQNYCVEGGFKTHDQVRYVYLACAQANYVNRAQIQWLIEDKSSGSILGIRDLFVDNAEKPVTVQGFIGRAYRKQGYSKEAYNLIIDYTRQKQVVGLMANVNIENFSAIALLHSVNFKPYYIAEAKNSLRLVFLHDYTLKRNNDFNEESLKGFLIFCEMCLDASEITYAPTKPIMRDGALRTGYKIQLLARNTLADTMQGFFSIKMTLVSDGVVIMAEDDAVPYVSYVDGRMPYINTWGFCWQECLAK